MCKKSKSELRVYFKNVRNSINDNAQTLKSENISKFIKDNFSDFSVYFTYLSFQNEVKTGDIINYLINNDKKILIPKCDTKKMTMIPVEYRTDDFFAKNEYGILESDSKEFADDKIDVIFLPALTVDRHGSRIGFGKGYYDKFINSLNYKPILIGLCYDEQVYSGVLPTDKHDVKLDYVVTDVEIIKICEK